MGFIWIATDRGVVRFNGDEFQNFTVKDGLTSNTVYHIREDSQKRIWYMGSDRGLSYINNHRFSKEPKIVPFKYNYKIQDLILAGCRTLSIHPNSDGIEICSSVQSMNPNIIISYDGIVEITKKDASVNIIQDSEAVRIFKHLPDPNSPTLQLTLIKDNAHSKTYEIANNSRSPDCNRVALSGNKLYFNSGMELYSYQDDSLMLVDTFQNEIISLHSNTPGEVYVGLRKSGLIRHEANGSNTTLIPNIYCSSIFTDDKGGLWVGSLFNGLFYLPSKYSMSLSFDPKRAITKIQGSDSDLIFLDSDFNIFRIDQNNISQLLIEEDFAFISSIIEDPISGKLFGFGSKPLKSSDVAHTTMIDFHTLECRSLDFSATIRDIIVKDSSYFSLNKISIYRSSLDNQFIERKIFRNSQFTEFDIINDTIFLCDKNGLKYIDNLTDSLRSYSKDPFLNKSLLSIHETSENKRIVVSRYNGIKISKNLGLDTILTTESGLISNTIDGAVFSQNKICVWSNSGISIINDSLRIFNLDINNGLPSNSILDVYMRNDTLWIATDVGLGIISLNDRRTNENLTHLLIGIETTENKKELKSKYEFGHNENYLLVSFQGLNYSDLGNSEYRYKLQGHNEKWIETKERKASFSGLEDGSFNFLISMKTANGWTDPISLFELIKLPAYWQTWWFYLLCSIVLLTLIITYFQSWKSRTEEKNKLELSIIDFERKALQAQMNPHFIFNSLSSLQSLIIDQKNKLAEEYLIKFSRLTRLTLNHSSEKQVRLKDELTLIKNYIELELLRFEYSFNYKITCHGDIHDVLITPMLIQPLVENAILHGLAPSIDMGELTIDVNPIPEEMLSITIKDDGIGFKNSISKKTHRSKGINLIINRLNLISRKASLEIRPLYQGHGTMVVLTIPYSKPNE